MRVCEHDLPQTHVYTACICFGRDTSWTVNCMHLREDSQVTRRSSGTATCGTQHQVHTDEHVYMDTWMNMDTRMNVALSQALCLLPLFKSHASYPDAWTGL